MSTSSSTSIALAPCWPLKPSSTTFFFCSSRRRHTRLQGDWSSDVCSSDLFGRYGVRLHELARGLDNNQVTPDRPTQSISAEDTFEQDVTLAETEPMIRKLAENTWSASRKESRIARTVVLKLKTNDFRILTRSHTPGSPPSSCEELTGIALSLRERIDLSPQQRFRLVGVGLSNFRDPEDASAQ